MNKKVGLNYLVWNSWVIKDRYMYNKGSNFNGFTVKKGQVIRMYINTWLKSRHAKHEQQYTMYTTLVSGLYWQSAWY